MHMRNLVSMYLRSPGLLVGREAQVARSSYSYLAGFNPCATDVRIIALECYEPEVAGTCLPIPRRHQNKTLQSVTHKLKYYLVLQLDEN